MSQVACRRSGWAGRGWGGWWGGLAAGGWLYFLLGLSRVAMSPRSASYRPRHAWRA